MPTPFQFNRNDGTFAQVSGGDLTGFATLTGFTTSHAVLLSENTGFGYASPGTTGQVLTSNGPGTDPSFQAAGGITFTTTHAVLLSETTTTFGYVGSNTTGLVLTAQGSGSDPIFNQGIAGLATGGSATAGNIGEIVDSGAVTGVGLTSSQLSNLTSITPGAGIWLTFGYVVFHFATSNGTAMAGGQSTASNSFTGFIQASLGVTNTTGTPARMPIITQPWTIGGSTNLFLNVQATFGNTCTADGRLWALRVG